MPPRNPINSTILTQLANSLAFKFRFNWLRASLVYCELTQSQISRLCYLLSRFDVKGSPRIDKAYLLRLFCAKPHGHGQDVTHKFYSQPRDSSTRHSFDPTTSLFTPHDEVISDWQFKLSRIYLQRRKSLWQQLVYTYEGTLFPYWLHHGIPRRRFLTGRRQTMGGRFFGLLSEILVFAWGNCFKHVWNLPATSQMHIRSLGLTWELAIYAPPALELREVFRSSWPIRSHCIIIVSIYLSFIHREFLWFVVLSQVDNKSSEQIKLGISLPHTVTIPTLHSRYNYNSLASFIRYVNRNRNNTFTIIDWQVCKWYNVQLPFSRPFFFSSPKNSLRQ